MKQKFVQVKVSLDLETYTKLCNYAELYNWSLSATLRKFVELALSK